MFSLCEFEESWFFFPWQIVPAASASQLTLVDLICALSTLQTDTVLHLAKEVVKRPPQIRGDEVGSLGIFQMNAWHSPIFYKLCLGGKQRSQEHLRIPGVREMEMFSWAWGGLCEVCLMGFSAQV